MNRCQMVRELGVGGLLDDAVIAKLAALLRLELVAEHYCYCQAGKWLSLGMNSRLDTSRRGNHRMQLSTSAHLAYALLEDMPQLACFEACNQCSPGDSHHLLVRSRMVERRTRTAVLVAEAQKRTAHMELRGHCYTASSIYTELVVVVVEAGQTVVALVEYSTGRRIEFAEYRKRSEEAIHSQLGFHKTVSALSPVVFAVDKPLDCMVDVMKSCCLSAARLDYIAKQLVVDTGIGCEQTAAGCM